MPGNKERRAQVSKRRNALEQDQGYAFVKSLSIVMDDWFLDPILGLFFPAVGDFVTSFMTIPYYSIALFKIRSIPLVLAITYNMLIDMLVGAIPFGIGDILDFFHRSYKKNYQLIVGFVEDDPAVVSRVKARAWKTFFIIVGLVFALCKLIAFSLAVGRSLWGWVRGLFT